MFEVVRMEISCADPGTDPGVNLTGAKGMWRQSRHRTGGAGAKPPKGTGVRGRSPRKIFWGPRPLNLLNT